jgi:ubiquinone/menaquinone biosynthesis C-methylase UbiE
MLEDRLRAERQRIRNAYDGPRTAWSRGDELIGRERRRRTERLLRTNGMWPPKGLRILDAGCGSGTVLRQLLDAGARPQNLHGVDLLSDRIEAARRIDPALNLVCGDAAALVWPDDSFDLVIAAMIFSSILEPAMSAAVAAEIGRVLKPGAAILWYDVRFNNRRNPHTRPVGKAAIRHLFAGFSVRLSSSTLLPPLARRLGPATDMLYPCLTALPPLRSHYLGLLRKPAG